MTIRHQFYYEFKARKNVSYLLLILNCTLIFCYRCFGIPSDGISIPYETIKSSITKLIFVVGSCVTSKIYIDHVRFQTIDEIRDDAESKEGFVAAMFHEIRNPLQSLLGSVELIQQGVDRVQQNFLMAIIKNCCDLMLSVISNMLDLTKIEAQKLELSIVPSSLNENINMILRISASRAMAKGVSITYMEENKIPPALLLDPLRLQQVVINLLSNSVKFTSKGRIVVNSSWIPFHENSNPSKDEVAAMAKKSNWEHIVYPMNEIEDPNLEMFKMQKIHSPNLFVPSMRPTKCMRSKSSIENTEPPDKVLHTDISAPSVGKSENSGELPCCPLPLRNGRISRRKTTKPGTSTNLTKIVKGLIKIEVMDTGIGISKEARTRLFHRYRQADKSIAQYLSNLIQQL